MTLRLAGAGTTIGLSEPDILGMATALSSLGIEAESGKLNCPPVWKQAAQKIGKIGEILNEKTPR